MKTGMGLVLIGIGAILAQPHRCHQGPVHRAARPRPGETEIVEDIYEDRAPHGMTHGTVKHY